MSVKWYGDRVEKDARKKTVDLITRAAIIGEAETKRMMGRVEAPSAPGEPPAVRTGRYRASITHEVDAQNLVSRYGTNMPLGAWLEIGTRYISPRPHLRPAMDIIRKQIK